MDRIVKGAVLAAALAAGACAGNAPAGEGEDAERVRAVCDERAAGGFCSEYLGELSPQGLAFVQSTCAGTWTTGGTCPPEGRDASCTRDLASDGVTGLERFWAYELPYTGPDNWFERLCGDLGGTYAVAP